MLQRILIVIVVPLFSSLAMAQPMVIAKEFLEAQPAAATQPAPTTAPAAGAATPSTFIITQQPTAGSQQPMTLTQVLANTRLGKLAQGEQVSLNDLRDPAFWIDTVKDLVVALVGFIPRIIVALMFLLIFWVIYRAIRRVLVGSMAKAHIDPSIRDMLGHLVKWSVMGFGVVIACNQIGVQIAALLTGVSIIGLAIGFAAQETLANFIAGVVIFWDKPFRVGDWVEIDGVFGQVQRVTFRSTRILDLDGDAIVFPNTYMLSHKLANHSSHHLTRVNVGIGIAYKDSIQAAREVLLGLVKADNRIVTDPAPSVVVDECASSSVNLKLRFWIAEESLSIKLRYEYLEKAKEALDRAGISIPFPHMQMLVEDTPALDRFSGAMLKRAS